MATLSTLDEILSRDGAASFVVKSTSGQGGKTFVFHGIDNSVSKNSLGVLKDWCADNWGTCSVIVSNHHSKALSKQKSLEDLDDLFGEGDIVYDPSRVMGRVAGLVRLAKSMRAAVPNVIKSIGFEGDRCTVYVILKPSLRDNSVASIRTLMLTITGTVENWNKFAVPDFPVAVRVGFAAPQNAPLMAIDAASVRHGVWANLMKVGASFRKISGIAALVGFGAFTGAGFAATTVSPPSVVGMGASVQTDDAAFDTEVGQDFWADPTMYLLGVPELTQSQPVQPPRRALQAVEWSVNAARTVHYGLAPIDVRFFAVSDAVPLNSGGYRPEVAADQSSGDPVGIIAILQCLSNADCSGLWVQLFLGNELPKSAANVTRKPRGQGYTI
jgi:hypothetical protein